MSVDRQHGKLIFICDECGDDINTGEADWIDGLRVMRSSGWGRRHDSDGGQWQHLCQDCEAKREAVTP